MTIDARYEDGVNAARSSGEVARSPSNERVLAEIPSKLRDISVADGHSNVAARLLEI